MIAGFTVLLLSQLVGEALTRVLRLPVPGPVVGLVLLFATLQLGTARGLFDRERIAGAGVGAVSAALLANLGLLFVPAGTGVVQDLDVLGDHAAGFSTVLAVSTLLAMLVAVGAFRAVRRWQDDLEQDRD